MKLVFTKNFQKVGGFSISPDVNHCFIWSYVSDIIASLLVMFGRVLLISCPSMGNVFQSFGCLGVIFYMSQGGVKVKIEIKKISKSILPIEIQISRPRRPGKIEFNLLVPGFDLLCRIGS